MLERAIKEAWCFKATFNQLVASELLKYSCTYTIFFYKWLFTFCYLNGANSIKIDLLHICNLWTDQFVSLQVCNFVLINNEQTKFRKKKEFRKSRIFWRFRCHECIIELRKCTNILILTT